MGAIGARRRAAVVSSASRRCPTRVRPRSRSPNYPTLHQLRGVVPRVMDMGVPVSICCVALRDSSFRLLTWAALSRLAGSLHCTRPLRCCIRSCSDHTHYDSATRRTSPPINESRSHRMRLVIVVLYLLQLQRKTLLWCFFENLRKLLSRVRRLCN